MTDIEKFYDKELAPKLLEIAKLCEGKGIPFLAIVEYDQNMIARTQVQTPDEGIEMVMVRHCAKTAPNIDGYVIGLARWAHKHGINMDGSIVMRDMEIVTPAGE